MQTASKMNQMQSSASLQNKLKRTVPSNQVQRCNYNETIPKWNTESDEPAKGKNSKSINNATGCSEDYNVWISAEANATMARVRATATKSKAKAQCYQVEDILQ